MLNTHLVILFKPQCDLCCQHVSLFVLVLAKIFQIWLGTELAREFKPLRIGEISWFNNNGDKFFYFTL